LVLKKVGPPPPSGRETAPLVSKIIETGQRIQGPPIHPTVIVEPVASLTRQPGTSAATVEANQKLPGIHLVVVHRGT